MFLTGWRFITMVLAALDMASGLCANSDSTARKTSIAGINRR